MRATASTPPPAGNGTIRVIGRVGYSCAAADAATSSSVSAAIAQRFISMSPEQRADAGEPRVSFDLQIELVDEVAPLGRLAINVGSVLVGAGDERIAALGVDARLHIRGGDQLAQLGVEAVDDRLGGAGGRQQAIV